MKKVSLISGVLVLVLLLSSCASNQVIVTSENQQTPNNITTQKILRVTPKYVLVEAEKGVSEVNERVSVHRLIGRKPVQVGRIQLLKFHDGKAAGKIIESYGNYQIEVGDYIVLKYKSQDEMNVGEYLELVRKRSAAKLTD